ncbi:MAG: hybrid sensor histidine kinase/response regulator [Thermoanaerobaculia bacterium]
MSDPISNHELLHCIGAMADPERRAAAARVLAMQMGAEDLIVFVRDPVVHCSLPARGFPQTLPGAQQWIALIDAAVATGQAQGSLPSLPGGVSSACAVGLLDGTVAVFLGGAAQDSPSMTQLKALLPLLGSLLRTEEMAHNAEAEAKLARQTAVQASELASKLDTTRAELRRALTVAESATRSRDDFLATVSHELRTPLTSMIGWIQLLQDESDPELMIQGLDTIGRNARAQSRLIEDILDYSRINAGKLRLEVRPIELIDVIRAALDVISPAAGAKKIAIDSVLDPNAGFVSGDFDRLQQVAWNLLSNAAKFTPRGGRIQVRLERIQSHAVVSISDTGEGISPEFLPQVFERFSQADGSSTRVHSGLGLGLGIVKHLVELHGGTVDAFSKGPGTGSTFSVRLPVMLAREAAAVPARPLPFAPSDAEGHSQGSLSGVSILVVEDNDDARTLLSTILQRSGAMVATAENAAAAFQLLEVSLPDIIISDIEMPGEDGYAFIRRLRMPASPANKIPAIALTAHAGAADRVHSLEAGFQMHIGKPVEPVELMAALKGLLTTASSARATL